MRDVSMKIVGADVGGGDVKRGDALSFHVNHAVLVLHFAFDGHEAAAGDDDALALKKIGRDDDVGDAGFVFEREEYESLGSAGALAGNDAAGDAREAVVGAIGELLRGENTLGAQMRAMKGDGVRASGQTSDGVIGGEAFVGVHFLEGPGGGCVLVFGQGGAQQRADRTAGLLDLPERIAAMGYVPE